MSLPAGQAFVVTSDIDSRRFDNAEATFGDTDSGNG